MVQVYPVPLLNSLNFELSGIQELCKLGRGQAAPILRCANFSTISLREDALSLRIVLRGEDGGLLAKMHPELRTSAVDTLPCYKGAREP